MWILAGADSNKGDFDVPVTKPQSQTSTKTASDPNTSTTRTRPRGLFGYYQFIFIGLIFVMMYLLLFRGPRKKQQEHKQMVQALAKNDRVRTIGGIIGTVVDIKGDEITLKVDEANNTKIKIVKDAIGRNLSKD